MRLPFGYRIINKKEYIAYLEKQKMCNPKKGSTITTRDDMYRIGVNETIGWMIRLIKE